MSSLSADKGLPLSLAYTTRTLSYREGRMFFTMVKILIIQQKTTTNKTKQAELMVSVIITAEGLQRHRCFQKRINGNMVNKQASLVYNCSFANEENCAPLARPIQLWQTIGLRQRFEIR